jgi:hypothetical protein
MLDYEAFFMSMESSVDTHPRRHFPGPGRAAAAGAAPIFGFGRVDRRPISVAGALHLPGPRARAAMRRGGALA